MKRKGKKRERCPVCASLGQPSQVKRLQPIETYRSDSRVPQVNGVPVIGHVRFRYECSRGHEFDGERFHSTASHAELHNKP